VQNKKVSSLTGVACKNKLHQGHCRICNRRKMKAMNIMCLKIAFS